MVKKILNINNSMGIHARPAGLIANTAGKFECDIKLIKDSAQINAKSIMGILTLAAGKNSEITLICDGKDENEAAEAIGKIFEEGFDE